jgi:hypothetical protein
MLHLHARGGRSWPLHADRTVIRLDDLLPLDLTTVDTRTGRAIEATVAFPSSHVWRGKLKVSDSVQSVPSGAHVGDKVEFDTTISIFARRGVPFLEGERIRVIVDKDDRHGFAEILLGGENTSRALSVRIPKKPNEVEQNFGFICSSYSCGYRRNTRTNGSGSLTVSVHRRNGAPAARTEVLLRLSGTRHLDTDSEGIATFRDLPAGSFVVEVREPGFVYTEAAGTLGDGERGHAALTEPEGWTAHLRVVSTEGHPLPYAALEVKTEDHVPYVRLENDVQTLALYTDSRGEATLDRLPKGVVTVTAKFGTREAAAKIRESHPEATFRLPHPD